MSINDWFGLFWAFLGFMFGVIFSNIGINNIKHEAIDRGVAEYNSQTGDWQWKDSLQED